MPPVRAAFLPDTFHEVNGVAHTSRHLEAFARRHHIPLLSVHCGPTELLQTEDSVTVMQLRRSFASFGLDAHLDYDPLILRHASRVQAEVTRFGADLIHITGPGDMGTLGCLIARRLGLPLVISWHTSLHEYAARRCERLFAFLGRQLSLKLGGLVERLGLLVLRWFYRQAAITFAPNRELIHMLGALTGRPVFLMERGVDTGLFTPARRDRLSSAFRIGYVGRLTTEKNVRFLADLSRSLTMLGRRNFEIVIVGEGNEESWLREHLPDAVFTGVLRGERLADMYASFDLFAFPSRTDTFGNVVLEAMASGVPAIVTDAGGPKFLIQYGVNGFVAASDWEFTSAANRVMTDPALHASLRQGARDYALKQSWDAVFEQVFSAYDTISADRAHSQHVAQNQRA